MACQIACRNTASPRSRIAAATFARIRARPRTVVVSKSAVAEPLTKTSIPVVQLDAAAAQAYKQSVERELRELSCLEDTEKFEEESYLRLQQGLLTPEILRVLQNVHTDAASSSAVLLKGFPVEDDLPPTLTDPPIKKDGFLAEAVLYGLARVWGRAAGFQTVGGAGTLRDLVTANSTVFSSSTELMMHRDYGLVPDANVPDVRLIHCLRPDKARHVQTLVTDNRDIVDQLDPQDVHLLTTVPLVFKTGSGQQFGVAKPTITGSAQMPHVSLFDEGVLGEGSSITADDPAAVDAYHRASDLAMKISAGVKLEEGDLLVVHNGRAVHARTESPIEPDGFGRWLKVTFVVAYDRIQGYTNEHYRDF